MGTNLVVMGIGEESRRRILVPHALGADEFLRVTWHEQKQVMVVSHWQGAECVAAFPLRVSDAAELADLVVTAIEGTARQTGDELGRSA